MGCVIQMCRKFDCDLWVLLCVGDTAAAQSQPPPADALSPMQIRALHAIVRTLSARRGSKTGVWDLLLDLKWDQV